eukprot:CAMPEP_0201508848 /NCGR_PEP_ID=MMETSP0161_2-20130828/2069_1 /ASSEMBLY_ACC=CAM_ASM_000251 /TAXON_ID=180227 /ORGANISM="Neoparamoeba aestuarina, Strain SoJaBio B1-5/56/2" /LENGTH=301 /DNA_ID=CAMNT_0047903621 /DNA_START=378 /DNA_END=1283 /DNA_ORIENTATION=-
MSHSLNSLIQRDAHNFSPDFSKDVLQPMQAPVKSPPGSCALPPLRSVVGEFLPQPSLSLGGDVDMTPGGRNQNYQGSPLVQRMVSPTPSQFPPPSPMSPLGFPTSPQQFQQPTPQQQQPFPMSSPFQSPNQDPIPMNISNSSSMMQGNPNERVTSPLQGLRSPNNSPFEPSGLGSGSGGSPFGHSHGMGYTPAGGSGFGLPARGFPPPSKHNRLDRITSFSDPGSTMELAPEKGVSEEPKKKGRHCWVCGVSKTPRWRRGPDNRQLCNSCGLRYIRKKKKEMERKAPNTSSSSSSSSMNFD